MHGLQHLGHFPLLCHQAKNVLPTMFSVSPEGRLSSSAHAAIDGNCNKYAFRVVKTPSGGQTPAEASKMDAKHRNGDTFP